MGQRAVEPHGTEMIYCLTCGTANKDGSRFCDECGDQLAAQGPKRSDVPPWVAEMEETLRTQSEAGDDDEPQEVPDWFLDLQASQPDRYVEGALQLGVDENEGLPAWLAPIQGMQTSAEPPEEIVESLRVEADFAQADGDSVQTETGGGQIAAESQQTVADPQVPKPLWAPEQTPRAAVQPPRAGAEPSLASTESTQSVPKDRTRGEPHPEKPQELRDVEPVTRAVHESKEGHDARVQSLGWPVQTQAGEGAGEPKDLVSVGETAEGSLELSGGPLPAVQEPSEEGTLTGNEGSGPLLALKLRALRDREAKPLDGMIALDKSSATGEWLQGLVEALPVQASIVQGQGTALPERERATPDRFASRARLFSEIVTHPPQVAPVVAAQPRSDSRSPLTRYALYAVLIAIALGVILVIAFNAHPSPPVGWLESIFETLGGLTGG